MLQKLALALLATAAAVLLVEGARTLALGGRPHTSVVHGAERALRSALPAGWRPWSSPAPDAERDLRHPYLREREELEALLPLFKSIDAGIGNTDFHGLVTENAAVNTDDGGCTRTKPDLRKSTQQLRTRLFDVYDPPVVFHDADRPLPDPIRLFLDRYRFRTAAFTTNGHGERLTLPVVARREKVLVAGDSVALGLSVDDGETLASALQQADTTRQYVNLGISGVGAGEIACSLEAAADRYPGQISELIYVFCDNDYDASDPRASADAVVAWLKAFGERRGVPRVTMVRAPFLELLFPIAEDSEADAFRIASGRALARRSREAGFRFLDIGDLALAEAEAGGSLFGPFRMFVDHVHLSPYGAQALAHALLQDGP